MLSLLSLLASADDGLRADEVAEALGKSASTAYSLLDTLCQEGFVVHAVDGAYRLTAEARSVVPAVHGNQLPGSLDGVLDELFTRTHKRVYLAAARSGQVVIPLVRGRQGMPLIPGLGSRIGENAHALALGKVALSLLGEAALQRYIDRGLRVFTPATISSPEHLRAQLAEIRSGAVAFDCEEFRDDFCCLAAPVRNAAGRPVAALGISMSARCFELERAALTAVLADVAERASAVLAPRALPAISEDPPVLESAHVSDLRSRPTATIDPVDLGEEVLQ
ncbi:MAG: acetyl-CoA synthetase [Solirubrobacteraceae bacterium]|nr:acetyl-CoA synthetase [Solirubrobacteraceae bacterium]